MTSLGEKKPNSTSRSLHRNLFYSWIVFFGAALIFASGFAYSFRVSEAMDQQDRSELLTRVETMAFMMNGSDVAALAGTESDLASPEYGRVKNALYGLHNINSG